MAKSGIYPIKGWGCSKCDAEMIGVPKGVAQKHYNVPIDKPFPIGFTFRHTTSIYRITGKGTLSQSIDPNYTHGWNQSYEFCAASNINHGFLLGRVDRHTNSKQLKRDFEEGFAKVLDPEDIAKVKKANPGRRVIRKTSVLEKVAQSA